jgi:hypothetical protein
MRKLLLLATAGVLIASASFADNGKKNKKKCAKGKTCCSKDKTAMKSCHSEKAETTVKL